MTSQEIDLKQLKSLLEETQKTNKKKYKELKLSKYTLDPNGVIMDRLNTLIDYVLQDEVDKLLFEMKFELLIEERLNKSLSQVNQAKLTLGLNGTNPNKLILPD